ncbi:two-component sensor histidine kinase [Bacillaceae bacterium SAS-127]|nr:two-component sensor histidine kinase [Bacillaceae bacterium SAS-127]
MSFFREKQSRYFFFCMIALSTFLLSFGVFFGIKQTQTAKEMLLSHDGAVASSLLQQGVSPDIIASAIANTKDDGQGENLLMQIGYTEKTGARFLPVVSDFAADTFQYIFFGILAFVGILLALCTVFLAKRERLYRQATKIILKFAEGNFTAHLPRSEEGAIYQLFDSVDNLATALQAKGEIEYKAREFLKNSISDISHQLKTPLAALNMYNEIISDEPDNPVTITEFSQKTTVALDRMEQLIQSLLKITRLDVGSVAFEKDYYPISEIVAQATEELTTRATREEKQIIVSGQSEEQITCDFQWTSEAVGNIVKNALDHTSSGGHIRISWECSPAMVRIVIADDGMGIASEDIHHIFKRFYRSKNSKETQGVGLGLSLAKAIVEGQGGILSVQSTQNVGTTFILSFLTES